MRIRARAYEICLTRGAGEGSYLEDSLQAERAVIEAVLSEGPVDIRLAAA
jgi:hypothetical protein